MTIPALDVYGRSITVSVTDGVATYSIAHEEQRFAIAFPVGTPESVVLNAIAASCPPSAIAEPSPDPIVELAARVDAVEQTLAGPEVQGALALAASVELERAQVTP